MKFSMCVLFLNIMVYFAASEEIKFFPKSEVKNLNICEIIKLLYIIYLFDFLIKESIYMMIIFFKIFNQIFEDKISLNYQTIRDD